MIDVPQPYLDPGGNRIGVRAATPNGGNRRGEDWGC